jgi:hypothetical protein
MKRILAIIFITLILLTTCSVEIGYQKGIKEGKAYVIKDGVKIGETDCLYDVSNNGFYVLVDEEGKLYKKYYERVH